MIKFVVSLAIAMSMLTGVATTTAFARVGDWPIHSRVL